MHCLEAEEYSPDNMSDPKSQKRSLHRETWNRRLTVARACNYSFTHLAVTNMDGVVRACCMFELPYDTHWEKYKLKNLESFDNVLNSDEWKDYRQRIKTENIKNCNWCWKQEKSIKSSKRTEYNAIMPIKDAELTNYVL